MAWSIPQIALRRTLDEDDPWLPNVEVFACNGVVSLRSDVFAPQERILEIGNALKGFPRKIPDSYEVGLPPLSGSAVFKFRAYTVGSLGHVALKVKSDNGWPEPHEAMAELSIVAEPASVDRFGQALATFSKWKHMMLRWTPRQCELFEEYQSDL